MSQGFWTTLPQPFFALAPMAGVTDAAFRRLIAAYGKPHVLWTEFVSADGLCSPGHTRLRRDLTYSPIERPIVAQLYGANPTTMEHAAALVAELGFDGLDINMGCPDRSIEKRGAGAALCKNPLLAQAMIRAAQRGGGGLPVSVKIRLGYEQNELETWLPALLEATPAVITIHARTRKDMSRVPARWEALEQAAFLRQRYGSTTYLMGNGDVMHLREAHHKARAAGIEGVMLGRAIFGNPWLFHPQIEAAALPIARRLQVMLEHTWLFTTLLGDIKSFEVMKKHFKAYISGLPNARALFIALMESHNAMQAEAIVTTFLETLDRQPTSPRQTGQER